MVIELTEEEVGQLHDCIASVRNYQEVIKAALVNIHAIYWADMIGYKLDLMTAILRGAVLAPEGG
ncbi:hypothetical protein LCGC14_1816880 [marine sediment metagenome]|uniref:Uncharacterized protein n=2 Tax=marine sediment metagenome TaxID=412755 RepID=A0A0F9GK36_9ZZZZ